MRQASFRREIRISMRHVKNTRLAVELSDTVRDDETDDQAVQRIRGLVNDLLTDGLVAMETDKPYIDEQSNRNHIRKKFNL